MKTEVNIKEEAMVEELMIEIIKKEREMTKEMIEDKIIEEGMILLIEGMVKITGETEVKEGKRVKTANLEVKAKAEEDRKEGTDRIGREVIIRMADNKDKGKLELEVRIGK